MEIITNFRNIGKIAKNIGKIKGVVAIYLFGSYAFGKQHNLSDIDLCIIGDLKEEDKIKIMGFSSDNLDISFFDELPVWIQFRVFKNGKELVGNKIEKLNLIKIFTLKKYLDFKPLINRLIEQRLENG